MQQKAIMHESGPVMCLAGPGSGKTFVLTYHIKYLIEELNVEPSKILVITFSKAAAKEMQQRFVSIMGNQILPVKFGTCHAIFFHMLCQHQGYSANSIISLQEKKKYLKIIIQEIHSDLICDQEILEEILQKISFVKNKLNGEQRPKSHFFVHHFSFVNKSSFLMNKLTLLLIFLW